MPRYSFETIVGLLVLVWVLGWLVFPVVGHFIHLLLVVILAIVLIRFVQGGTLRP